MTITTDFYWAYCEEYGLTIEGYAVTVYFDSCFEDSEFIVSEEVPSYGYVTLGNWCPI